MMSIRRADHFQLWTLAIYMVSLWSLCGCGSSESEIPKPSPTHPQPTLTPTPKATPTPQVDVQPKSDQPAAPLPASQIAHEFSDDEPAATKKYSGQTVEITGVVHAIERKAGGLITVKLEGFQADALDSPMTTVDCYFRKLPRNDLDPGTSVTVRCKYMLGGVGPWFTNCKITSFTPLSAEQLAASAAEAQALMEEAKAVETLKELGLDIANNKRLSISEQHLTSDGRIKPDFATHIAKLVSLESLSVMFSPFSDAGMKQLPPCRNLRTIHLEGQLVTDTGIAVLKDFPNLQYIYFRSPLISDAAFEHLKGLKHVRRLKLSEADPGESRVTDAALTHVADWKYLEELLLPGAAITGPGLKHLSALPKLDTLDLRNSPVDSAAINNLKKAKPNLNVEYSGL